MLRNIILFLPCLIMLSACGDFLKSPSDVASSRQEKQRYLENIASGQSYNAKINSITSKIPHVAMSSLLASYFANQTGANLSGEDLAILENYFQEYLENSPTNKQSSWQLDNSRVSIDFVATRTFQNSQGIYCREFTKNAIINGEHSEISGVACRKKDGIWEVRV